MRHYAMVVGLLAALLAVASGCKSGGGQNASEPTPAARQAPAARPHAEAAAKTEPASQEPVAAADVAATPIAWETDLDAGLQRAKTEGKPLMVDFYADWCVFCHRLDDETYSDAEVQREAARFVCVKVDTEARSDLKTKYGIQGLPTVVLLASDGHEVHRIKGYLPPGEFIREIEKGPGS